MLCITPFSVSCSGSEIASPIFPDLLFRPDVKKVLEPGTHLVHLAKVGSDFATGHGRLHQKTKEDIDMDGSHNSGFQTLLLSKVQFTCS